ncbi:hypothetical protein EVAR_66468_1 [Eumeta japonica]|uniref:Uncharacterized protein n=1 Tax=Eumeta variegata TaxID=151549 RepID=A0A4C1SDK5_EUMVA|nr:hypothetical protein EVAR_66468_1 [Eumeta japonica]
MLSMLHCAVARPARTPSFWLPGPKRTKRSLGRPGYAFINAGSPFALGCVGYESQPLSIVRPRRRISSTRAISVLPMRMTGTSNFSFLVSTIALVFDGANLNLFRSPQSLTWASALLVSASSAELTVRKTSGPRRPRTPERIHRGPRVRGVGSQDEIPKVGPAIEPCIQPFEVILLDSPPAYRTTTSRSLRSYRESSVPRCGMKPYCRVCSFGIICHWMRQTSILSTVSHYGRSLWDGKTLDGSSRPYLASVSPGRYLPGPGKYPSCKHLFAMARNNPSPSEGGSISDKISEASGGRILPSVRLLSSVWYGPSVSTRSSGKSVPDDPVDTIPYALPVLGGAKPFPARRLGIRCCPFINLLGSHIFLDHIPASARGVSDATLLVFASLSAPLVRDSTRELRSSHRALSRYGGVARVLTHSVYRSTTSSSRSHESTTSTVPAVRALSSFALSNAVGNSDHRAFAVL